MIDLNDGTVELTPWEKPHYTSTDHSGTMSISLNDMFETLTAHATPVQARQLAAALVALADEIEGEV